MRRTQHAVWTAVAPLSAAGILAIGTPTDAAAEGSENRAAPIQIEEVVVTALKTGAVNIQDTPATITAFSGEALKNSHATDVTQLSQLLTNARIDYFGASMTAFIRGVGSDNTRILGDQNVGFYVDGVYIEKGIGATTSFVDVERVEVLKGPQGTLYGRNTTGGAVNIITRAPSADPEFQAALEVGDHAKVRGDVAIGGPIVGTTLLGRLSVAYSRHDGYVKNETGPDLFDEEFFAARGGLLFQPTDRFDVRLSADYRKSSDNGAAFKLTLPRGVIAQRAAAEGVTGAALIPGDFWRVRTNSPTKTREEDFGASLTAKYDLTDSISLTSVTAYRTVDQFTANDYDGTQIDLISAEAPINIRQLSQELQLNGEWGRAKWILGGFYYDMRDKSGPPSHFQSRVNNLFPGLVGTTFYDLKTEAVSVFGDVSFALTDQLKISAGARYSHEEKDLFYRTLNVINGAVFSDTTVTNRHSWGSPTYRAVVEYKPADNILLYASATEGFKAGTLNPTNPILPLPSLVSPENVWAYELGAKTDWYDGRLRLNAALFHYDYKDLQVQTLVSGVSTTTNAAGAEIDGVEIELAARPTEPLTITAAMGYLDARYGRYDAVDEAANVAPADGNMMIGAPKWSFTLAGDYKVEWGDRGAVTLHADLGYKSRYYFTALEDPLASQPAQTIVNALVRFESADGRWGVEAFGRNLTEEEVYSRIIFFTRLGPPFGPPLTSADKSPVGQIGLPRTFGVKLTYQY